MERLAERSDHALGRELAVPELTPLVLCDGAQHRPGLCEDAPLLGVRQSRRGLDVEDRLDARSDFCACCPPGPLDREVRSTISLRGTTTLRVTRIDSDSLMAGILIDVDGVLQGSGEPIAGAADAIDRLRGKRSSAAFRHERDDTVARAARRDTSLARDRSR